MNRFTYVIKTTFLAVTMCLGFLYLVAHFAEVSKADGGGVQTVSVMLDDKDVERLDFIPIHTGYQIDEVETAFAKGHLAAIIGAINSEAMQSFDSVSPAIDIELRQSWSDTMRTSTNSRLDYCQSYRHAIIHAMRSNGTAYFQSIELPEYCRSTEIHFSPESSIRLDKDFLTFEIQKTPSG